MEESSPGDEGSTSPKSSQDTDKQSPKQQLTKEQEKIVQDRVTAHLAKKGDKAKTLEEQVKSLTTEVQTLKDEKFAKIAANYDLSVDDLK